MTDLSILKSKVDALYEYNNRFYERRRHTADGTVLARTNAVRNKLDTILLYADSVQDNIQQSQRSTFYYYKGRAANIMCDVNEPTAVSAAGEGAEGGYASLAKECLTRAVKLASRHGEDASGAADSVSCVAIYNELALCLWHAGDTRGAERLYLTANSMCENKVSLRSLSMMARSQSAAASAIGQNRPLADECGKWAESAPTNGDTSGDLRDNFEKSLRQAKRAVELDMSDGISWRILGNAYFYAYFNIRKNAYFLKQCLFAYDRAVTDPDSNCCPILHYNRAICLRYEDRYGEAVLEFSKSSRCDPRFSLAGAKLLQLAEFLRTLQASLTACGRMRRKRLLEYSRKLSKRLTRLNSLGCIDNDPTNNTQPSNTTTNSVQEDVASCHAPHIALGANAATSMVAMVTDCIRSEFVGCTCVCVTHDISQSTPPVPHTIRTLPRSLVGCVLNIYNVSSTQRATGGRAAKQPTSFIAPGDIVTVRCPFVRQITCSVPLCSAEECQVEVEEEGREDPCEIVDFLLVRVDSPLALTVNGRQLSADWFAPDRLLTTNM